MKVQEYKIGNTIVEVYDDAICGEKEVKEIIKRIGKIGNKRSLKKKKASA